MLAIDILQANILILRLYLDPLAHEVVTVVHNGLELNRSVTLTELGGLKCKGDELTSLLNVLDCGGGVHHNGIAGELHGRSLQDAAAGLGYGVELLLEEIELGAGGETTVAIENLDAHVTTGHSLIKTAVDHLVATVGIGAGVANLASVLEVLLVEQAFLGVGGVHSVLLEVAVGGNALFAACIADRLERNVLLIVAGMFTGWPFS